MRMGGMMKHLTNLTIAAGVFIFTKLYADAISFNSIELSGVNLVGHLLVMIFAIQWIAYLPAFIFKTEKFYDLTAALHIYQPFRLPCIRLIALKVLTLAV